MKKGFAMIELIFVIVILGILASVAIPRLAATRDDAEVVKATTNLTTLISDLGAYYTSQGGFAKTGNDIDIKKMTNVALKSGSSAEEVIIQAANNDCLTVTLKEAETKEVGEGEKKYNYVVPAYLTVKAVSTPSICASVANSDAVQKLTTSSFTYTARDANGEKTSATQDGVAVSGVGVVF